MALLRAGALQLQSGSNAIRPAKESWHGTVCRAGRLAGAAEGILPLIRQRGEPHGSGLGTVRCVVEHANAWLLANKRLDRRNDRLTNIIDALLTTACIFVIANRLTD